MNFQNNNSPSPLYGAISELTREGFIAYCGAGISIPAPTCAPSWWVLTEEILYGFFDKIPKDWGLPNDLIVKDPDLQPEEVFESFAYVFDEMLYDVFKALDFGSPNANHQIIARLAKSGILKACFTTNFDSYIEKSLTEEGVDYRLMVENPEFDKCLIDLRAEGIGSKFLLCKIHGTTERPKTIVSIASAYKSSKGFSTPKAEVLIWLLNHYPCLFLGYSGWDFEHLNYRRFWERAGKRLRKIYWNRRPGDSTGPDFSGIFSNCRDRFVFCEGDLPKGLISALEKHDPSIIDLKSLTLVEPIENDHFWEKNKNERIKYFGEWTDTLPNAHKLAAALSEGELLSAKFKARQKKLRESTSAQTTYMGPDPKLQQRLQELGTELSTQKISLEEYQKRSFEIQLEMQLEPVREDYRPLIKSIFLENKYPGFTDDSSKQQQLLPKIVALLDRFEPQKASKIAVNIMKRDEAATLKGEPIASAERTLNLMYHLFISPEESEWKPYYEEMILVKDRYLKGDMDFNSYKTELGTIFNKAKESQLGVTIPVDDLLKRLIEVFVAGASNEKEFRTNVEAFHLAANYRYAYINSIMFKTPEYKAIQNICYNTKSETKPETAPTTTISPETQQKLIELGKKYSEGQISIEEYQKKAMEISMASISKETQTTSQISEELPTVPIDILEKYDKRIRDWMRPVLEAQQRFFGEELNETRLLIEMTIFAIWIAGTQYLDLKSGEKVQQLQNQGLYPKVTSNPSVSNYMWNKNKEWIEKALNKLPKKFIQRLYFYLITFSEMTSNFELCKKITEKSLELTGGVINETVYHNIPICLAAFYHEKGDIDNALKYYMLALDSIKMFVPSVWSDVSIYQTARLTAESGKKEDALQIIGTYHSDFRGNLPPYAPPARVICKNYAEQLASELGYMNAKNAVETLFK